MSEHGSVLSHIGNFYVYFQQKIAIFFFVISKLSFNHKLHYNAYLFDKQHLLSCSTQQYFKQQKFSFAISKYLRMLVKRIVVIFKNKILNKFLVIHCLSYLLSKHNIKCLTFLTKQFNDISTFSYFRKKYERDTNPLSDR